MRFVQQNRPWQIQNRVPDWDGDTGGTAQGLPDPVMLAASADAKARVFRVWGWTPQQGDFFREVPFSQVQVEAGPPLPTGRIDTMGPPVVMVHGGMVKLLVKLWGGDGGGQPALGRVYTWIYLVP